MASIYDTTVAWRDDKEISLAEMVAGKSCSSSIIVRRIPMEHVPTDEKECSQFIHEIYREKVYLLLAASNEYLVENTTKL